MLARFVPSWNPWIRPQVSDRVEPVRRCSWVVGRIVAAALGPVAERLNRVAGVELQLLGLPSPYWGQDQVVTGLLTGEDLLAGLAGRDLGDELLLPGVMLRQGHPVFLDDMTLDELRAQLPVPVRIVHGAADIVASVLGQVGKTPRVRGNGSESCVGSPQVLFWRPAFWLSPNPSGLPGAGG